MVYQEACCAAIYSRVPLQRGIIFDNAVKAAELQADLKPTRDTQYLWGVYCEDLWENRARYNGTALYILTLLTWAADTQLAKRPAWSVLQH